MPQMVKHTKEEGHSSMPPSLSSPPSFPPSFLLTSFLFFVCQLLVYLPLLTHVFTHHLPRCLHLSSVYLRTPILSRALPTFHSPLILVTPSPPPSAYFLFGQKKPSPSFCLSNMHTHTHTSCDNKISFREVRSVFLKG